VDPNLVLPIAFTLLFVAALVGFVIWRIAVVQKKVDVKLAPVRALKEQVVAQNAVLASGTPGTAQVLFAGTGGPMVIVGGGQLVQIVLRVQVAGRAPYDVQIQQPVGPVEAGALQPGATVEVRVDPANPGNVGIDFSKPIRPPQAV
jgi:hypothetical protein